MLAITHSSHQTESSMDDGYYLCLDPTRLAVCGSGHQSVFLAGCDNHMRTSLCIKALQMAFWLRKPPPGYFIIRTVAVSMRVGNTANIWRWWRWNKAWAVKATVGIIRWRSDFFVVWNMDSLTMKNSIPMKRQNWALSIIWLFIMVVYTQHWAICLRLNSSGNL